MLRALTSRVPAWGLPLGLGVVFLALAVSGIWGASATFDESAHLPVGYQHLRDGDYGYNQIHPPLLKMLAPVPLLFTTVNVPPRVLPGPDGEWPWALLFLYRFNDADRLLFLGRIALLPVALLLAYAVYAWATELLGRPAGLFALTLFVFEPNVLAHAPLVTTDMGVTCFMFLTVYALYRLAGRVTWTRIGLLGLGLGLALTSKLTSVLLLPLLGILTLTVILGGPAVTLDVAGLRARPVGTPGARALVLLPALVVALVLAYVMVWAAYRFRYEALPGGDPVAWAGTAAPGGLRGVALEGIRWMQGARLLPEAYLNSFATALDTKRRYSFLAGTVDTGHWTYFFITMGLKTPLPLLVFLAAALPSWLRRGRHDPRPVLFLAVPVGLYFGLAVVSGLNIGHRHLLPILPFLFVLAAAIVPGVREGRTMARAGCGLLLGWYVVGTLAVCPHFLAYFNKVAGGPRNGYRFLVDSNLDWGQDLKRLGRYMETHGIERVWLSYFGSADPRYYGIAANTLPGYPGSLFEAKGWVPTERPVATPFVAISVTNLQGVYLRHLGRSPDLYTALRSRSPMGRVGYTMLVFRLAAPAGTVEEVLSLAAGSRESGP